MNKKLLLLLFMFILLLTACSGKNQLSFVDESDNWRVEYIVWKLDGNRDSAEFSIIYIGDEQIPKDIHYSFDYPSQQGLKIGGNTSFEGEVDFAGHDCDDCTGAQLDDEITAIIEWDGKSETFNLKSLQSKK